MVAPVPGPDREAPRWFERRPWKDVFEVNLAVFQAFLIIYLVLLLIETLRAGAVTRFLPLNAILGVVLVTGVAAVLTTKENAEREERPPRVRDYVFIALIALGSWLILWYQLRNLGWIQYPVSILGGVLVGLVSLSLLLPEPEEDPEAPKDQDPAPIRAEPPASVPPRSATVPAPRSPPGARHRFKCPQCANPGSVPIEKVGARVRCPKCATVFRVGA